MDETFIRDRISVLRTKKGISEYKMSLDLGHSKTYIQSISSGRALPSLSEFVYICDYLGVTPKEFFDTELKEPSLFHTLTETAKTLSEADLLALLGVARRLGEGQQHCKSVCLPFSFGFLPAAETFRIKKSACEGALFLFCSVVLFLFCRT